MVGCELASRKPRDHCEGSIFEHQRRGANRRVVGTLMGDRRWFALVQGGVAETVRWANWYRRDAHGILLSRYHQRIGDKVAETIVVPSRLVRKKR
jgi:hypothetical protein